MQTIAPPCKNTPVPGRPEVPGAVDPKTTTCMTPPRPSGVATAAETGVKTVPDSSIHSIAYRYGPHRSFNGDRGLYDYAGPRAGYGWYDDRWDLNTWSTGNGYY